MEQLLTPLARIRLAAALDQHLQAGAARYQAGAKSFLDVKGEPVPDEFVLQLASINHVDLFELTRHVPNENSFVDACNRSAALEAARA